MVAKGRESTAKVFVHAERTTCVLPVLPTGNREERDYDNKERKEQTRAHLLGRVDEDAHPLSFSGFFADLPALASVSFWSTGPFEEFISPDAFRDTRALGKMRYPFSTMTNGGVTKTPIAKAQPTRHDVGADVQVVHGNEEIASAIGKVRIGINAERK